jgi:hypothetical protein
LAGEVLMKDENQQLFEFAMVIDFDHLMDSVRYAFQEAINSAKVQYRVPIIKDEIQNNGT